MIGVLSPILTSTLLAGGLTQNVAPAEQVSIGAMAATGTGLSLAGGGGRNFTARSPIFLNVEVPVRFDNLNWLEITPGIQLELEDRVGVAAMPRFRAYVPVRRPRLYAVVGGVFYLHPYKLHGAQVGFGFNVEINKAFGLYAELVASAFFAGSDLMEGSGLGKIDGAAGFRVNF